MKIELNKEDIKSLIGKDALAEALSREIICHYTDEKWDEFTEELKDAFRKTQKEIVNEYIDNYFSANILLEIKKALGEFTREELTRFLLRSLK